MQIFNSKKNSKQGFTLIELVITMTLAGILFAVMGVFMSKPIQSYVDSMRRLSLVDAADSALKRMGRDIQNAVPNSIRVKSSGTIQTIEMMNIVEGQRYRAQSTASNQALNFSTATTDFDVWQNFQYANLNTTNYRLIIYNTGAIINGNFDNPMPGANVYSTSNAPAGSTEPPAGTHVITPPGRVITLTNPSTTGHVNISGGGWQFAFPSPQQRLFVSDGPVSYVCDTSAGTITRYSGYSITDAQPTSFSSGVNADLLANNVSACTFTYLQGTTNRNGLAVLRITISQSGESVSLINEIGVSNVP